MIDFNNKGFFKLKQNDEYAERVSALLIDGEHVIDSYKSMRDGVVFTNKRIISVNVQGITGSKKDFTSLPYKNIVAYSVETFIQVDPEKLKTDCMEWGISTVDTENFRRLTPKVIETESGVWHLDYDTNFAANELNIENFNYCLDIVLDFLLKKQEFDAGHKWPKRVKSVPAPPIYIGKPIFEKPSENSNIIGNVKEGYYYSVDRVVSGFNAGEQYLYVHLYLQEAEFSINDHIWGYLLNE